MEITKSTSGFVANRQADKMARGLGWFSIALGLAQIMAPRKISRIAGLGDHRLLIRLVGLRELATGLGILTQSRAGQWLTARMVGDAMDLALLGRSALTRPGRIARTAIAGAVVTAVTGLDYSASKNRRRRSDAHLAATRVTRSVIIDRPAEELFTFWRNFENLPRVINHLRSVRVLDERRSHWEAKGPAGSTVAWDAEIINEHPNELIAWRTVGDTRVGHAGSIRFSPAPGNRGTLVKVELEYYPAAGVVGAAVAKVLGQSPEKQIAVDLRRFKQLMETGEIARTEGQPAGRQQSASRKYDDLVRA